MDAFSVAETATTRERRTSRVGKGGGRSAESPAWGALPPAADWGEQQRSSQQLSWWRGTSSSPSAAGEPHARGGQASARATTGRRAEDDRRKAGAAELSRREEKERRDRRDKPPNEGPRQVPDWNGQRQQHGDSYAAASVGGRARHDDARVDHGRRDLGYTGGGSTENSHPAGGAEGRGEARATTIAAATASSSRPADQLPDHHWDHHRNDWGREGGGRGGLPPSSPASAWPAPPPSAAGQVGVGSRRSAASASAAASPSASSGFLPPAADWTEQRSTEEMAWWRGTRKAPSAGVQQPPPRRSRAPRDDVPRTATPRLAAAAASSGDHHRRRSGDGHVGTPSRARDQASDWLPSPRRAGPLPPEPPHWREQDTSPQNEPPRKGGDRPRDASRKASEPIGGGGGGWDSRSRAVAAAAASGGGREVWPPAAGMIQGMEGAEAHRRASEGESHEQRYFVELPDNPTRGKGGLPRSPGRTPQAPRLVSYSPDTDDWAWAPEPRRSTTARRTSRPHGEQQQQADDDDRWGDVLSKRGGLAEKRSPSVGLQAEAHPLLEEAGTIADLWRLFHPSLGVRVGASSSAAAASASSASADPIPSASPPLRSGRVMESSDGVRAAEAAFARRFYRRHSISGALQQQGQRRRGGWCCRFCRHASRRPAPDCPVCCHFPASSLAGCPSAFGLAARERPAPKRADGGADEALLRRKSRRMGVNPLERNKTGLYLRQHLKEMRSDLALIRRQARDLDLLYYQRHPDAPRSLAPASSSPAEPETHHHLDDDDDDDDDEDTAAEDDEDGEDGEEEEEEEEEESEQERALREKVEREAREKERELDRKRWAEEKARDLEEKRRRQDEIDRRRRHEERLEREREREEVRRKEEEKEKEREAERQRRRREREEEEEEAEKERKKKMRQRQQQQKEDEEQAEAERKEAARKKAQQQQQQQQLEEAEAEKRRQGKEMEMAKEKEQGRHEKSSSSKAKAKKPKGKEKDVASDAEEDDEGHAVETSRAKKGMTKKTRKSSSSTSAAAEMDPRAGGATKKKKKKKGVTAKKTRRKRADRDAEESDRESATETEDEDTASASSAAEEESEFEADEPAAVPVVAAPVPPPKPSLETGFRIADIEISDSPPATALATGSPVEAPRGKNLRSRLKERIQNRADTLVFVGKDTFFAKNIDKVPFPELPSDFQVNDRQRREEKELQMLKPVITDFTLPATYDEGWYRARVPLVVKVQTAVRGRLARRRYSKHKERKKIAYEIFTTEKNYMEALVHLHECRRKLEEEAKAKVKADKIKVIWQDQLVDMIELARILTARLEAKVAPGAWHVFRELSDVFLDLGPRFAVYVPYITHYNEALEALQELTKANKRFQQFSEESSRAFRFLDFAAILIMPIQRIPRYILLLKALIKITPRSHPDYDQLNKALDLMSTIATDINNQVKKYENHLTVCKIDSLLVPRIKEFVQPDREFVGSGMVIMYDDKKKLRRNKQKVRTVFLFSDVFLLAKHIPASGVYHLKFMIYLNPSVHVEHNPYVKDVGNEHVDCVFRLHSDRADQSITLMTRTMDEKISWLIALEQTLFLIKDKQQPTPD